MSFDGLQGGNASADAGPLCAQAGAVICDDFNRMDAAAPEWAAPPCDPGGTLTVDGSLVTTFVATAAGTRCALQSNPTDLAVGHFTLDFDIMATAGGASDSIFVAGVAITPAAVDARGIAYEQFQLLLDGAGHGNLGVVVGYSAGNGPGGSQFPFYSLAGSDGFIPLSTSCHVSLDIDGQTPSVLSATSTCAGKTVSMVKNDASAPPTGFTAKATVSLGYGNPQGDPVPAWSITYDNLVFERVE